MYSSHWGGNLWEEEDELFCCVRECLDVVCRGWGVGVESAMAIESV